MEEWRDDGWQTDGRRDESREGGPEEIETSTWPSGGRRAEQQIGAGVDELHVL